MLLLNLVCAAVVVVQCNYAAASELINKTTQEVLKGQQMPIDLEAKAGICAAHTGDMLESDKHLHKLLNQNPAHYMDLFMDAGMYLMVLFHTLQIQ